MSRTFCPPLPVASAVHVQVCVAARPATLPNCTTVPGKSKLYYLAQGDDCPGLLRRAELDFKSIQHVEKLNQGFRCSAKNVVGTAICAVVRV